MSTPAASSHTTTPSASAAAPNEPSLLLPRAAHLLRTHEDAASSSLSSVGGSNTTTPSRPFSAASSSLRPLSSSGGPYYAAGASSPGWNTVASSARTSYTHVNLAGIMDDASDAPPPAEAEQHTAEDGEDRVSLCFLCVSGGRKTMSFPAETAVGRVKELLLNAWPQEWIDDRPPGATYLRILHQGKILQDEDTLLKLKFPVTHAALSTDAAAPPTTTTTIVHVSIRPVAPKGDSEDDGLKKRGVMSRLLSSSSMSGAAPPTDGEHGAGSRHACGCIIC